MQKDYLELAEFFKVFGDNTRLKILHCIEEEEKSVNEIADEVGQSSSTVSHQLRVLRNKHLVRVRREGKLTYYNLDDNHIREIFRMGEKHLKENLYE